MKKRIVIIVVIIIILITTIFAGYFMKKKLDKKREEKLIRKAEIVLSEDLTVPFLEERKVSNFIVSMNGKIVDDYKIDTTSLGKKEIKFDFITDEGIKASYQYEIEVKDVIPPTVLLGGSYRVKKGSSSKFIDNILCGDDYDSNPKCEIVGDYDLNKEGSYPVVFKATDSSGNVTEKNFKLVVYVPKQGGGSNPPKPKTYFSDIVKEHKNDKTRIGIDISKWQGDVDFKKLKNAGVEFVILRVGSTKGTKGDYFVDGKFKQNIKRANEVGMPVGIYFYSYATSKEKAIADANWILEQIKDYKVDLPIAFDWENWSFYNDFNLSFFGLTDMANSFLDVFKEAGYEGMLYSSRNYLEQIWLKTDYPIWLAHYTYKTSYSGPYSYWQMCNDGRVDGIYGDVDINIRYK